MLWLAFWSFGCYMIVVDIFTKPFGFKLVLAVLMLFGPEICVASMILLMIFGRTVFTFRREGGTRFTGVGRFGRNCRDIAYRCWCSGSRF